MARQREYTVDSAQALKGCQEKPAAISWPVPVDRRLDELVAAAEQYGERTTRKELAAALLFRAPAEGEALSALLRAYRRATASDALLEAPADGENVLRLPRHRPGPRAASS